MRPSSDRQDRIFAILDNLVCAGTMDAHLVALDAKTGNVVRDVEVSPAESGHSTTAAPLVVRDKVIVGIADGEFGVRGFRDAYDDKSGKRVWWFWTVPVSGESGIETRADDSWKKGSVTTWAGFIGFRLKQSFLGTGNPAPDWHEEKR